ncbi:hypothetical protein BH11ACT4_BH11ACT4_16240 [soil metagenome]
MLYAGGEGGEIYRIDPHSRTVESIAETGGFVLGMAVDGSGTLYACDNGRSEILTISPTGDIGIYSIGTTDRQLRTPNYASFDAHGNLYVSDSGEWGAVDGCIFRISPGGKTQLWSEAAAAFPNGLALSPDTNYLYVVESFPPAVVRIAIAADGSAGAREVLVELPGLVPDGIAFAIDGSLYIACYRPDAIYRLSLEGALTVFSEDPQGTRLAAPTNIAFDGTTLYAANFARWHLSRFVAPVAGLSLHYPRV